MKDLFQQLATPFTGEQLFDCLPDIVYFIKNVAGQYQVINKTLVERCGLQHKSQLIGHTPSEVLGNAFGRRFEAQDQKVIQNKQALLNQLELHAFQSRQYGWCLTSKLPLLGKSGEVVGLIGISKDLRMPDLSSQEYEQLSTAIKYAESHMTNTLTVKQISQVASMSPYQLDRRIQRVFGLTTGQWLLKLRIERAERQLFETDLPIATIALNSGYSDQSTFTRQFHRTTGISPANYRSSKKRSNK